MACASGSWSDSRPDDRGPRCCRTFLVRRRSIESREAGSQNDGSRSGAAHDTHTQATPGEDGIEIGPSCES